MDRIDTQIIAQLQADGRLSITELAERVGLTPHPPCARRVQKLEADGVITGYTARVGRRAAGLSADRLHLRGVGAAEPRDPAQFRDRDSPASTRWWNAT